MNIKKLSSTILVAVISSVITVAAIGYYNGDFNPATRFANQQTAARFARFTNSNLYTPGNLDFTYAAAMTTPAVVHIKTTYNPKPVSNRGYSNDPFRDFFGNGFGYADPYHNQPQESSGSGVIISDDGYIVTNNHVVEDGDKFTVILADKNEYDAKVVGTDPSTDLAVIKIESKNLPFIIFGNSDSVRVGQWVLAVGNPFNLESTVTAGIVSAKGRNINLLKDKDNKGVIESYIQTDAAVNPGNSGGALVNPQGELVGINSAIATPTGTFAGYSFAVPANLVRKVVNDIMKFGTVQRGYLGVGIADITGDFAKEKGIENLTGVYVDTIYPGSASEEAGLKVGDIITKVNGTVVNTVPSLQEQVANYHPGDKITISYLRNGSENIANIVLKNREGNLQMDSQTSASYSLLGAQFADISAREKKDLGIAGGAKITKIEDGKLSRFTDIREGFIITKVDNKQITSVADLKALLENKKGGVMIEGTYADAPGQYFYAFGL
ncbi:serine protease [Bacteroidota bacterium]|nr:serine protease [Bacteroidota bacterium]